MSLYHCDACNSPMAHVSRYRWDACSAGCDTSACVLCSNAMFGPTPYEILDEIEALGEHLTEQGVAERISALQDHLAQAVHR